MEICIERHFIHFPAAVAPDLNEGNARRDSSSDLRSGEFLSASSIGKLNSFRRRQGSKLIHRRRQTLRTLQTIRRVSRWQHRLPALLR